MDFTKLPHGGVTLTNVTVPACLAGLEGDLVRTEISIDDGRIGDPQPVAVDMGGAMVFPAFVDMHTHLDKGHIWPRSPNPDGTFAGALATVRADSAARWSAGDLRPRMEFSLRAAFAHGTRAIRTHLDSIAPQDDITWPVFRELQEDWADRIELQAACLIGCDKWTDDDGPFGHTADLVAATRGGVLGMVTYPMGDLRDRIRGFFAQAAARGLDADFHVDETMDAGVETLRDIAELKMETGFSGRVVVGHCCSLSAQDEGRALDTLDLVAKAGIDVVSLPMCNLYLQDRTAEGIARTPRRRGITLVHEMRARGIRVSFASDNTRDPFYAYGDMDMLEVMREATRIGHLDHSRADWVTSFLTEPAATCGIAAPSLDKGAPADLVICKARNWTELFARPQADRIVLRGGVQIDRKLPDYAELDDLMRT
ncbi:cytosine deaminase [Roseibacterium sp. SDUM158017]|uniref:cytosine deaminase n=1 Tax=Roseicyclus salinarum TaxID=3036773 RepID=UPI0024150016|nr:cytosine deaminase [Roseibacterium sp. SDUM158017]MDG4647171.1 cytosine deaminase [Roseibacterium sp. SDUM158017]